MYRKILAENFKKLNWIILKIKNKLKFIIYHVIFFIVKYNFAYRKDENLADKKKILFIRLDAIGDYILFSNFIEIIRKSDKYKDYKITLLGNEVWKEIAEEFDGKFIDNFIWLNRKKFNKNFIYRYQKFKEIVSNGYEIVINPRYSREFYYDDSIVEASIAKRKIGSEGDLSNIEPWQKKIGDSYYTKLIPAKKEIMFEFYRNKEFFEGFLGETIDINRPHIDIDINKISATFNLPDKFATLYIGASNAYRKWNYANFVEVALYLKERLNLDVVICGGEDDALYGEKIVNNVKGAINLCGKTSLMDMIYIIKNSVLLISNETFAPHMAVALDIKNIFVISNGNHFGRFVSYPKEICANYHVIYHPDIEKKLEDYKKLSNSYGYGSSLDINEITAKSVIENIEMYYRR